MEIIQRPRRGGKTVEMLRYLRDHRHSVLVVMNQQEYKRVLDMLREQDRDRDWTSQIVLWDGRHNLRGRRHTEILIDNLDLILQREFSERVTLATITRE